MGVTMTPTSDFLFIFHEAAKALNLIFIYKGSIASIPAGWHLCDGTAGTDDLRDRFVVGARQDQGGVAKTNLTGSLTSTGGTNVPSLVGSTDGPDSSIEVQSGSGTLVADTNHTHPVVGVGPDVSYDEFASPYFAKAYIQAI